MRKTAIGRKAEKSNEETAKKNIKEEKAKDRKKKREDKEKEALSQTLYEEEIMPVTAFDDDNNFGIMFDGKIIDIMRIRSKDIYSADGDRIFMEQMLWDRLYKTYSADIKEVSFNFPTDTSRQQAYIDTVATRTENPVYRELLAEQKEKLIDIHQNNMDKEYLLCFFSESKVEHSENILQIKATLCRTTPPLVEDISPEKKKRIIHKLYNKNVNL